MNSDEFKRSTNDVETALKSVTSAKSDAQQFAPNNVASVPSKSSASPNEMVGKLSDFLGGKSQGLSQVANVNSIANSGLTTSGATEFVSKLGDVIHASGKATTGNASNGGKVSTLKDFRRSQAQSPGPIWMPSKTIAPPWGPQWVKKKQCCTGCSQNGGCCGEVSASSFIEAGNILSLDAIFSKLGLSVNMPGESISPYVGPSGPPASTDSRCATLSALCSVMRAMIRSINAGVASSVADCERARQRMGECSGEHPHISDCSALNAAYLDRIAERTNYDQRIAAALSARQWSTYNMLNAERESRVGRPYTAAESALQQCEMALGADQMNNPAVRAECNARIPRARAACDQAEADRNGQRVWMRNNARSMRRVELDFRSFQCPGSCFEGSFDYSLVNDTVLIEIMSLGMGAL